MSKESKIKAMRSLYNEVKSVKNRLGKKTLGTSSNSPVRREYNAAKREYLRVGKALGKLTGKKPRRGR